MLLNKFEPQSFLSAMQQFQISIGFLVPPITLFLSKHPMVSEFDLSPLKWIMSGAAPLDAATQSALSSQLDTPIIQGWGMTELSPIGTVAPPPPASPIPGFGSSGQLAPSTRGMILDPQTGASLPAHELGELVIAGPQVMRGYLNRPEATAETLRPDGFLRTGDLAYYDEAGCACSVQRAAGTREAPAPPAGANTAARQCFWPHCSEPCFGPRTVAILTPSTHTFCEV